MTSMLSLIGMGILGCVVGVCNGRSRGTQMQLIIDCLLLTAAYALGTLVK